MVGANSESTERSRAEGVWATATFANATQARAVARRSRERRRMVGIIGRAAKDAMQRCSEKQRIRHSARNDADGSALPARRAGTHAAINATIANTIAIGTAARRSSGASPADSDWIAWATAMPATAPTTDPIPMSVAAGRAV